MIKNANDIIAICNTSLYKKQSFITLFDSYESIVIVRINVSSDFVSLITIPILL